MKINVQQSIFFAQTIAVRYSAVTTGMASDVLVARRLTIFAAVLFVLTSVLLLEAGSQRNNLLSAAASLRHDVIRLNRTLHKLRNELGDPGGCKQKVRPTIC